MTPNKILNIDDNPATRYWVSQALRGAGFEVIEASTGREGLKLAQLMPDLIVLDVQLPDISGFAVCEEIKFNADTSSIPVLHVLDNYISGEDQAEGLEGGADGYLTHPMDPRVLIAAVRNLIRVKQVEQKLKDTVQSMELERKLRDQFVSTLTHDLRNPLTAAKVSAQVIGRVAHDPAKQAALVGRIIDSLDRANRMIDNLLDANQIKAGGPLALEMKEANLQHLIQETLEELTTVHGSRFVIRGDADITGYWSPNGMRRIIENLANNAIKYGSDRTPVTIDVHSSGSDVKITVHNEGSLIKPEDQKLLFEPFYRANTAQESGQKGWGLGLTLVRGLTEAHGGKVEVESHLETGTAFKVFLPMDSRSFAVQ
jgi:signal transduction histidine kinase